MHLAERAATAVAGRREQAVTRTRAQSARPGRRASRTLTFFLTVVKLRFSWCVFHPRNRCNVFRPRGIINQMKQSEAFIP